jgi:hypothetical protein
MVARLGDPQRRMASSRTQPASARPAGRPPVCPLIRRHTRTPRAIDRIRPACADVRAALRVQPRRVPAGEDACGDRDRDGPLLPRVSLARGLLAAWFFFAALHTWDYAQQIAWRVQVPGRSRSPAARAPSQAVTSSAPPAAAAAVVAVKPAAPVIPAAAVSPKDLSNPRPAKLHANVGYGLSAAGVAQAWLWTNGTWRGREWQRAAEPAGWPQRDYLRPLPDARFQFSCFDATQYKRRDVVVIGDSQVRSGCCSNPSLPHSRECARSAALLLLLALCCTRCCGPCSVLHF